MLKLTKTGIGLLTKQYRSVLRKCLLLNLGLFTLETMIVSDNAYAMKYLCFNTSGNMILSASRTCPTRYYLSGSSSSYNVDIKIGTTDNDNYGYINMYTSQPNANLKVRSAANLIELKTDTEPDDYSGYASGIHLYSGNSTTLTRKIYLSAHGWAEFAGLINANGGLTVAGEKILTLGTSDSTATFSWNGTSYTGVDTTPTSGNANKLITSGAVYNALAGKADSNPSSFTIGTLSGDSGKLAIRSGKGTTTLSNNVGPTLEFITAKASYHDSEISIDSGQAAGTYGKTRVVSLKNDNGDGSLTLIRANGYYDIKGTSLFDPKTMVDLRTTSTGGKLKLNDANGDDSIILSGEEGLITISKLKFNSTPSIIVDGIINTVVENSNKLITSGGVYDALNYYYTFRVDERVEAIEFTKELRSNKKEMSSLDFMPIKSSSDLRINLIKAEDPLTFSAKTRDDSLVLMEVCHA